jgi:hypothetical protein
VLAMAEVEPRYVHTRLDKRAHALRRIGGGAEGADDLCATSHNSKP